MNLLSHVSYEHQWEGFTMYQKCTHDKLSDHDNRCKVHIYIYTLQGLQYPKGILALFVYIPGAIWTIQHLSNTLAIKGSNPGRGDENCELNR